jgi:phosphotransferase system IIB component
MGIFERISLCTESLTNALHTNDLVSNNEISDIDKVELGMRATGVIALILGYSRSEDNFAFIIR